MLVMNTAEQHRNVRMMSTPSLWPVWPYLPLVRRCKGSEELGLLCDLFALNNLPGYSGTVFFCNLFALPETLAAFLALDKEVHDTPEEIYAAGWRVD